MLIATKPSILDVAKTKKKHSQYMERQLFRKWRKSKILKSLICTVMMYEHQKRHNINNLKATKVWYYRQLLALGNLRTNQSIFKKWKQYKFEHSSWNLSDGLHCKTIKGKLCTIYVYFNIYFFNLLYKKKREKNLTKISCR